MSKEEFIEKIKEIKINVPNEEFFIEYNKEIYKILDNLDEIQGLLNYTTECLIEKDNRIDKAIEHIKEFLCTEEYINVDGKAIAENYSKILEILQGGNNEPQR